MSPPGHMDMQDARDKPEVRDPEQAARPESRLPRTAASKHGVVATSHPEAARAGVEVLEAGGNAFDAVVATALALCVCEPAANGLGGQSMLLGHDVSQGRTIALDGSSRAPSRALPEAIPPPRRRLGHASTTIPSTPAVYNDVLERFGRLSRHDVMAPAIRLASKGFTVTPFQHAMQVKKLDRLRGSTAAPFMLKDGRDPYEPGEVLRQPVLARTLRRLEQDGWSDFYTGRVARDICRDMAEHGGLIEPDDLAQVPWPIERRPEWGRFDGQKIVSFPPAGAGRVLLQILDVADHLPRDLRDPDTPHGAVAMARNIHQALVDHIGEPRHPALHAQLPQRMHGRDRNRVLADRMRRRMPTGETSHTSVMDSEGNAVGLTQSIEEFFGSCAASPDLGFIYNNYIGAFDTEDPSHPYHLRPNAVPWSSVAPAIVFRRGRPRLVIGSPGSERIASVVGQVLVRTAQGMKPYEAIDAPRMHAGPDGRLHVEGARMDRAVLHALEQDGWELHHRNPYALYMGSVQMAWKKRRTYHGAADPRRDGSAEGAAP